MTAFLLTMNRASEGDCLILQWGSSATPHHALIDLGRTGDYRALRAALAARRRYELMVVTHVDADHIEGAMPMVQEAHPPFEIGDIWFNAYHHLIAARDRTPEAYETYGAKQGEKLSEGIIRFKWPWNARFGGAPVSLDSDAACEAIAVEGGLTIRLLSPTDAKLAALAPQWLEELEAVHLRPFDPDEAPEQGGDAEDEERYAALDVERLAAVPFAPDTKKPNGSSIAFVAEHAGRRVLLAGDAHTDTLEAAIKPLADAEGGRYRIDCLKLSHHGSRGNTSLGLLRLLDCTTFAFSTNGTRHGHPDDETIARILINDPDRPKNLVFNFRQPRLRRWTREALCARYRYTCVFPDDADGGITIPIGGERSR